MIEVTRPDEKEKADLREILDEVVTEMCENYCKYPDTWDEESEGCELCESDVCKNCPLGRLV